MQPKYKFTYARLKIALIIAISFFSFFAKTQETDSVRIAINIILAPLNKTLIPTGILATNAYSQDSIKATSVARQKYLKKSNSQRVVSIVMLGIGVTTAAIAFPKSNSMDGAVNAIGISMASGITGIILYLASIRNRKKAMSLSAGFTVEKQDTLLGRNYESYIPAVSLRFAF